MQNHLHSQTIDPRPLKVDRLWLHGSVFIFDLGVKRWVTSRKADHKVDNRRCGIPLLLNKFRNSPPPGAGPAKLQVEQPCSHCDPRNFAYLHCLTSSTLHFPAAALPQCPDPAGAARMTSGCRPGRRQSP
jgi:hypothetical protein